VEALRWVLLCEEAVEDEEEPVAEECLLVPLVMGLGRTLARDRLLAVRASLASYNGTVIFVKPDNSLFPFKALFPTFF